MLCDQNIFAGRIEVVVHNKLPGRDAGKFCQRVRIGVVRIGKHAHLQTGRNASRQRWGRRVLRIGIIPDCAEGAACSHIKC